VPQAALKALGIAYGVIGDEGRAPAESLAHPPGDVIVGVKPDPIRSVAEFNSSIGRQGRGTIGLLVRRADADLYIRSILQRASGPCGLLEISLCAL